MNTPLISTLTHPRRVERLIAGQATSDGAGVKLTRVLTQNLQRRLDPFLMLDAFGTDNPGDYIGGFPDHPHRGFETVTYMLDGRMRHRDSAGHEGLLSGGGVQWMTAGRGVIHSEMPEQERGPHGRLPALAQPAGQATRCARPGTATFRRPRSRSCDTAEGVTVRVIAGAQPRRGRRHAARGAPSRCTWTCTCRRAPASSSRLPADAQRLRLRLPRRARRSAGQAVPRQRMAILANTPGSDGVRLRAGARGRARDADRRAAAERADRAVRALRDEQQRRDLPGGAGLPAPGAWPERRLTPPSRPSRRPRGP